MSVHSPKRTLLQSLPVDAIAVTLDAFVLSEGAIIMSGSLSYPVTLVNRVLTQSLLPLVSSKGHLEGILTDFSMLNQGIFQHDSEVGTELLFQDRLDQLTRLDDDKLMAEARRCLISLRTLQTVQDAQALLHNTQYPFIPIVDDDGIYTGKAASREKLIRLLANLREGDTTLKVGGLATPLGVYLTTGQFSSGAGLKGLLLNGLLFGCLTASIDWLYPVFYSAVYALAPALWALPAYCVQMLTLSLEFLFILGGILCAIRLSPMAGIHASEHMTVNAIDAGLPLTPAVVAAQSRIHKRCGTNLMVYFITIQMAVAYLEVIHPLVFLWGELLYGSIVAIFIWRFGQPLGVWLQDNWTTKPPTEAQLIDGLQAGQSLLQKLASQNYSPPLARLGQTGGIVQSPFIQFLIRFWNSGFLMVLLVAWATAASLGWSIGRLLEICF